MSLLICCKCGKATPQLANARSCQDGDVGAAEHYEREAMREIQEATEACRRAVKTIKPQAA
jgi:hypothetical protein